MIDKIKSNKKHEKSEFQYLYSGIPTISKPWSINSNSVTNKSETILLLLRDVTQIKNPKRWEGFCRKCFAWTANSHNNDKRVFRNLTGKSDMLSELPGRNFGRKSTKILRLQTLVRIYLAFQSLKRMKVLSIRLPTNYLKQSHGVHHYLQDKPYIDSEKLFSNWKKNSTFSFWCSENGHRHKQPYRWCIQIRN